MNANQAVKQFVDEFEVPPNGVYVEVMLGSDKGDVVHTFMVLNCTIVSAAEQAALDYIQATGDFPKSEIYCLCYWADGAIFGPFPVDIELSASAGLLRGNADSEE